MKENFQGGNDKLFQNKKKCMAVDAGFGYMDRGSSNFRSSEW